MVLVSRRITVDSQGHIWVIHRPRADRRREGRDADAAALEMLRLGAAGAGFDTDGNLLSPRGRPGEGYEWVGAATRHRSRRKRFCVVGGNPMTTTPF